MKLLVATRSAHKLTEIQEVLRGIQGLDVVGLDAMGLDPDPREEGLEPWDTFEANARSKAEWFHQRSGLPTAADDSGLVVDALGGAPGVRSKRFAPGSSVGAERDRANNLHLLDLLGGHPPAARTARYVCAVAFVDGTHDPVVVTGKAEGVILDTPRGEGGFGYDPLFLDPELGRTFAEIPPAEKNARSHRGRAFRALASHLGHRR